MLEPPELSIDVKLIFCIVMSNLQPAESYKTLENAMSNPENTVSSELMKRLEVLCRELGFELVTLRHALRMRFPCATPLSLNIEPHDGQLYTYFACRSISYYWPGSRTDVHDLFSLYLACRLAGAGIASCSMLDEPHPLGIPAEIYARIIILDQPYKGWYADNPAGWCQIEVLLRKLADVERELHRIGGPCQAAGDMSVSYSDEKLAEWVDKVLQAPSWGIDDIEGTYAVSRTMPDWFYFHSPQAGCSGAVSLALGFLLDSHIQNKADERRESGIRLIKRGPLENSWSEDDLRRAVEMINAMAPHKVEHPTAIPLEDRLVLASGPYVLTYDADTGKNAFRRGVDTIISRQNAFLEWVQERHQFEWVNPVNAGRFEELIYAILREQPDVVRVRFVGSTNERDGGRDLLVETMVPDSPREGDDTQITGVLRRYKVIVQCKTKRDPRKGIGKGDVIDIRDTVERYDADGYWLFVSSRLTSPLIGHLESLQAKLRVVEWWTHREIEDAIRRHPRLVDEFADLVRRR
ncbi:hypothetical protein K1X22_06595 [Mycolicibacterium farcinogenes]|uniref:hypothetical protein n=1 Tax=Mycolicibacterium farcinogenes TaxID=1802 RepID=UPI001C8F13AA|nr:hypothetical protein [Mycolicibacterium farcinogenes]QZH61407.1 hypothetical protein K1X22_06595 [Mycolicibacterium farcinogenes]